MKSAELLRKLTKLAKMRGIEMTSEQGKGSHLKVTLNGKRTVVPVHNTELPKGTLRSILKALDLKENDL